MFCLEDSNNHVDASQNKNSEVDGYEKLSCNIDAFHGKAFRLPYKIQTSYDDLRGMSTFANNLRALNAKWHKSELAPSKQNRTFARREKMADHAALDVVFKTPSKRTRAY